MRKVTAELIVKDPAKFAHHDRVFLNNPVVMQGMGLAPLVIAEVFQVIKKVNEMGITVLLVEQNAQMALQVADRAYVLESGAITLSGLGHELLESDSIKKAYLGG